MSDQNYIDIEDDENGGKVRFIYIILLNQDGVNADIKKAMKECEGVERIQQRVNNGVVSKYDI